MDGVEESVAAHSVGWSCVKLIHSRLEALDVATNLFQSYA